MSEPRGHEAGVKLASCSVVAPASLGFGEFEPADRAGQHQKKRGPLDGSLTNVQKRE
jgi:hypothetical protein